MRCGNDHLTIAEDSRGLLFGIIYPAIGITCVFVLVRRIRRQQRRKYVHLGGQMDTPSGKSGGKEPSSATSVGTSCPNHTSHDPAPLPSACDILQPLSLLSPLPPSGYLAAVLNEERRKRVEQPYQVENERVQPMSPPCTNSEDSASMVVRTDCDPPSRFDDSPTQTDDSSLATFVPARRSAEDDDQGSPSSPDSCEFQSVQKRSQHVEFLRDVDEEGVRTWRRWVIEYN